jgi:glycosyltransferase involved in cell wall biosynthesis
MNAHPLISVVMPCHNAAPFVEDAVSSVLAQTYPRFELLAVDDGSTDNTLARLHALAESDPRLHVLSQSNRGPSAARNAALRRARGDYLCLLDADDAFLPAKLYAQLSALESQPHAGLVYSDYFIADDRLRPTGFVPTCLPDGDTLASFARRNCFAPVCPLFRRSLLDCTGLFDESIRGAEDWDFWIRCALATRFVYVPGPVALYRTHSAQLHSNADRMIAASFQVAAKHFPAGSRLHHVAQCCLSFSAAKSRYHARRYTATLYHLLRSELHSRLAGGLPLSVRDANTLVLPVAVAGVTADAGNSRQPVLCS